MSPELESRLFDSYPELFRARLEPGDEPIKMWGVECGDGWFNLLRDLASELVGAATRAGIFPADSGWPAIVQAKQKRSGLRVCLRQPDTIYESILDSYRLRSLQTCEVCGEPGKPNQSHRQLMVTCSRHSPPTVQQVQKRPPIWIMEKKRSAS